MSNHTTTTTPETLAAVYARPWSIEAGAFRTLCAVARNQPEAYAGKAGPGRSAFFHLDPNGIATIEISGVLTAGESYYSGATYGEIADAVHGAGREASAILFSIDSPGGDAIGNNEAARIIADCQIPTATHSPGMLCSAAYALAAGTDYITAAPSALVGSIGTIMAYVDESGLWESVGIKPDYIVSGDMKGAGMPPALSDAHREGLQQIVDDLFAQFRDHVLENRAIDADHMRGQAMVATRGLAANLIDATGTEDDARAYLLAQMG